LISVTGFIQFFDHLAVAYFFGPLCILRLRNGAGEKYQ